MKTQGLQTPRFIALFALCFALSELAQAVNPPPDGGYTGFNTAEGQNALFNLAPASGTQQLAGSRCGATPTAATTLPSAQGRFFSTSETKLHLRE